MIVLLPVAQAALSFLPDGRLAFHAKDIPKHPIVHKTTMTHDDVLQIDTLQNTLVIMANGGDISVYQDGRLEILSAGSTLVIPPGEQCQLKESTGQTHLTCVWVS
ncbi:hypothetical protein K8R42_04865 [bacterium]|nr:hypothetical protein [bacterium]